MHFAQNVRTLQMCPCAYGPDNSNSTRTYRVSLYKTRNVYCYHLFHIPRPFSTEYWLIQNSVLFLVFWGLFIGSAFLPTLHVVRDVVISIVKPVDQPIGRVSLSEVLIICYPSGRF